MGKLNFLSLWQKKVKSHEAQQGCYPLDFVANGSTALTNTQYKSGNKFW
jgi:hypothetical protein